MHSGAGARARWTGGTEREPFGLGRKQDSTRTCFTATGSRDKRRQWRASGRKEERTEGRKEGRPEGRKEVRKEGSREGRKEVGKEGRREGRREGRKTDYLSGRPTYNCQPPNSIRQTLSPGLQSKQPSKQPGSMSTFPKLGPCRTGTNYAASGVLWVGLGWEEFVLELVGGATCCCNIGKIRPRWRRLFRQGRQGGRAKRCSGCRVSRPSTPPLPQGLLLPQECKPLAKCV